MPGERTLAHALSTLRAQQGLTQMQVSLAMGAGSTSYLSKVENGQRANPSRRFIARYFAAFELLGRPITLEQRAAITGALWALPAAA